MSDTQQKTPSLLLDCHRTRFQQALQPRILQRLKWKLTSNYVHVTRWSRHHTSHITRFY